MPAMTPLYRQIADDLRRKIEDGELKVGDRLPTEDMLMAKYHSSRNTVRGAVRELVNRGLVDTFHGRGTYVAAAIPPIVTTLSSDPSGRGGGEGLVYTAEVAASGRHATSRDLHVELMRAPFNVAQSLHLRENTPVINRRERRYVDGQEWSLQDSYYPRSLLGRAPRLLNDVSIEEGTVGYLAECGIYQRGYRDSIEVRSPTAQETTYLDLPADGHIPVFEIYRIAFDQSMNRIRLTITVYRTDRNRFVVNIGDVAASSGLPVELDDGSSI